MKIVKIAMNRFVIPEDANARNVIMHNSEAIPNLDSRDRTARSDHAVNPATQTTDMSGAKCGKGISPVTPRPAATTAAKTSAQRQYRSWRDLFAFLIGMQAERLKSPGRDERFSTVKTPDFATRVHFFVTRLSEANDEQAHRGMEAERASRAMPVTTIRHRSADIGPHCCEPKHGDHCPTVSCDQG